MAGPTNAYSAIFTDVSGLAPADDVRIAGVLVGCVDKIELVGTLAKLTFRAQRNQPVHRHHRLGDLPDADRTAIPRTGERDRYKRTKLGNHDQIPKERTHPSSDISYTHNGSNPVHWAGAPAGRGLTNAIVQAFQGDSRSILTLTTQASALAELFAGPDQLLGDLIGNLDALMASLGRRTPTYRP